RPSSRGGRGSCRRRPAGGWKERRAARRGRRPGRPISCALPRSHCSFRTPSPVPIIYDACLFRETSIFVGGSMTLLPWLLCAAALAAGGDDKETPERRRILPMSAREAVGLSLNHNLDIEVARFQPWIEDQNVYAIMGAWDHTAYASVSGARSV